MIKSVDHRNSTVRKKLNSEKDKVTIIDSKEGWKPIDYNELKEYRDLFFFLVWKDVKALYAQTILGFSWAILQPLIQIIIFTFVFGKVAKVPTDGIPYILFATVGIIPWTYMSQSIVQSSQSLVAGQGMLGKVYFPRLIFPLTAVLSRLLDLGISLIIVICVAIYYRNVPTYSLLLFPLFILLAMSTAAGVGMWLSAMAIRFRDVKHIMPFLVRMLMYTAPIVYSASSIPQKYRIFYSLNPIVTVIEGCRATLLGTPLPWPIIWPGFITAGILLISGAYYFKRMERVFVDVI